MSSSQTAAALFSSIQHFTTLMDDLKSSRVRQSQPPKKNLQEESENSSSATTVHPMYEGREPAPKPDLPVEIMDNIIFFLPKNAFKPLFVTNSFMSTLATRRYYRTVSLKGCKMIIAFINCVISNQDIPLYIRVLSINLCIQHPTSNFYKLLQRLLRRTENLVSLYLELPKSHSPVWMLDGCTFKLKQLTTTMHSLRPLANFLETQDALIDLTLRGYQTETGFYIPLLDSPPEATPLEDSFILSSDALPRLRAFNAIHADGALVKAVVQGRPIEVVSIPLFSELGLGSLDSLRTSSKPLRRLSLISFDPSAPSFLFEAIAKRFDELEALHIVMLMAECGNELLEQFSPTLAKFKCLKYITFMAPPMGASAPAPAGQPPAAPATGQHANVPAQVGAPADSTSTNATAGPSSSTDSIASSSGSRPKAVPDEESEIAKMWHKACPTLRTIILPKGKVWFQAQSVVAAAQQQVQALTTAAAAANTPPVPTSTSASTSSEAPDPATSSTTESSTVLPSDPVPSPPATVVAGDDAGTPMEVVQTETTQETSEPSVQSGEWAHL